MRGRLSRAGISKMNKLQIAIAQQKDFISLALNHKHINAFVIHVICLVTLLIFLHSLHFNAQLKCVDFSDFLNFT